MTRGCATSLNATHSLPHARGRGARRAAAASRRPRTLRAAGGEHWPFVERYCVECHNETDLTADIAFDALAPDDIAAHAETFERAVRKLRGRMMPPPGGVKPERTPRSMRSSRGSRRSLDAAAPEPDPGYVTPHRMNRTEYANAIRDLLALEVDPATLLPVDGVEHGFDNIASALTVSPSFIDQFLSAARNLSAQAVGNPRPRAVGVPYTIGNARAQQFHVDGLPLGTRGGGAHRALLPGRRRVPAQHRRSRDGPLGLQPGAQEHARRDARRPQVLRARHRRRRRT